MRRLALLVFFSLVAGCRREVAPPAVEKPVAPAVPVVSPAAARQGLTAAERDRFYHLTMGSELLPLSWARALENPHTGRPFLADPERFGLLPDPDHPDRLPVGLTAAEARAGISREKMLGLTCAVCHVGEITYQGTPIRIDGGPSLFRAEAFAKELAESVGAMIKSPAKLLGFLQRLRDDRDAGPALAARRPAAHRLLLMTDKAFVDHLSSLLRTEVDREPRSLTLTLSRDGEDRLRELIGAIDHGDVQALLARPADGSPLAAFTTAAERETAVRETIDHVIETVRLLKARLAFLTHVKAVAALKLETTAPGPGRVDDFGAARNLLFAVADARPVTAPCSIPPLWGTGNLRWSDWDDNTQSALGRSVATALAAGAVFDPATHRSTVHLRNLAELDVLSGKLEPPTWPEALLGKIDRKKADRGAGLYQQHCAKCHGDPNVPREPRPESLYSLEEVGTDPNRALNYAEPLDDRPFAEAIQEMVGKYLEQACKDDGISLEELKRLTDGRGNVWRTTRQYAARPLAGIWATAPYLHNGSVPTLHDLLRPAKDRPKAFPVGHREYDPVKVGYTSQVTGEPIFRFDTTLTGNRNTGHEYGTDLPAERRAELIEYLKTL